MHQGLHTIDARAPFHGSASLSPALYPLLRQVYSLSEIREQFKLLRSVQRDSRGMPDSKYFFPDQERGKAKNISCSLSCKQAPTWLCKGVCGCTLGDCAYVLEAIDVISIRNAAMRRCSALVTGKSIEDISMVTLFEKDICPLLERSPGGEDKWNRISVRISDHQTISLCVTAYVGSP